MTVAFVHSMRGGPAPADWPPLALDEIREVLNQAGIAHTSAQLLWHSPRPLSAAAIIDLNDRRLFVKRHHQSVRTVAQLREEHGFIAHLQSRGISVSRVIRSADGDSAVACGSWTYEIHADGDGLDLYRDAMSWSPFTSRGHAQSAGRALASLHEAARTYTAPPRATQLLVSNAALINAPDPLAQLRAMLERRPALRDYLQRRDWQSELSGAIAPFHARYLQLAPQLETLWTHNDWHASNLLWSDASASASVQSILDFGLSDRSSAVYDLATAIERNTIPWLAIHEGLPGAADLALVSGLLDGYLAVRRLSAPERAALAAILPIVHVGFAVTEIDYFHGITHAPDNADLAYREFLLGHCAWFLQPEGRALLEHVNERLRSP